MSSRKTVHVAELAKFAMAAGNERKYTKVDDEGELKQWVGIGCINISATKAEREKWPKVIRDGR